MERINFPKSILPFSAHMAFIQVIIIGYMFLIGLLVKTQVNAVNVVYCYNGADVNSLASLKNETCLTKELHIQDILTADDYQSSTSPHLSNRQRSREMSDALYRSNKGSLVFCFIYRHIATSYYHTSGIVQQSVHVALGCDDGSLCNGRKLNKILHNVTGEYSQLYCCRHDNCNSLDKIPHTLTENRICYHGTNSITGNFTANLVSCRQPDASCAKRTIFSLNKKIEEYFCDNGKSCSAQMSLGAYHSCTNTTVKNVTHELCCCNSNSCFVPGWSQGVANGNSGASVNDGSSASIDTSGNTVKPTGPKRSTSSRLVTGLVTAAVIVAVSALCFLIVVALKQRKRRTRRDPNLIMQYERLSLSDADITDAVSL